MKIRESGMPEKALWETFFDPPAILDRLMLEDGKAEIAEFGCGYGTFTLAAAMRSSGTVRSVEIDPDMIAATNARAEAAGVHNIRVEQRDFVADGTGFEGGAFDYAMLFNILHAPEPLALLREAARILKPKGKVAAIHWNPTDTPRGPDPAIRPKPADMERWLKDTGFGVILPPTPLPPYHYGLVGEKP